MTSFRALCLVAAFASSLPAQVPSDSAIRALITARVDTGRFAGIAVGVVGKEDEFFLKVVDAQVTFTKDTAGVVTGLVVHQNGAHQPAKKRP